MRNRLYLFFLGFLGIISQTDAQVKDSLDIIPDVQNDIVEDFLNNTEAEGFEFNTLFETLDIAAKNKININRATVEELLELDIIDELAATSIINHISKHGKFITPYELQTVDNLSMQDLYRLLPYVRINGNIDDNQVPLKTLFKEGKNDLYVRWSSLLEDQKGFTPLKDDETGSRYLGSRDKVYARFKHSYENILSYGLTMEKDAGEQFFRGSNKQGFDFYSAHLFANKISDRIRAIALGDFTVGFGQGLILNSGFGRGKSADSVKIKRNGNTLKAFTSVAESNFMRGAGATIGLNKNLEVSLFGSSLNRDANIVLPDTLDQEEFFFSSLQTSGFHRTQNEIDDKQSIRQTTVGGNIKAKINRLSLSGNVLYNAFNKPFQRNLQTYNQFTFNSDRLLNASLDYTYIHKNIHFFGETAFSDNGAMASINSILLNLDRSSTLAVSYRHYDKKYQSLNANGFGETRTVNNESGLYIGLELSPIKKWRINAYIDIWQHPWLRSNIDAPSTGYEYLARVTYTERRKMEFYAQFRVEKKQRNNPDVESVFDQLIDVTRTQIRLHYKIKLNSAIELRSRLELSSYVQSHTTENSTGYLLYQDLVYKPKFSKLSLTTRIAMFDTDTFDSRIYAFENDLLYNFSIPAYFNTGMRYYLNLRYRATRKMTLEFRLAQTRFSNIEVISSGLNEIQGNKRTEIKAQLKYSF